MGAAAALCIQAVTNEADLAEMGELDSMVGDPTDLPENPTKAECTQVARSLPVICKMFGLGRRGGGGLMTSGSFVMMSANRAGNDEEELGEEDDEEVEEWDLSNAGKCNEDEEAWVQMDASDKTKGKCIQYAADTKCGVQCFHQGKAVSEDEEQAICSKICRVPGNSGAQCNVIKTVQPMMEESTELGEGKTMYLTRSKVTQADKKAEADPMACAGIRQN